MSNLCRSWLTASRATAPHGVVLKMAGAAVLGDRWGYTVELRDGTQIYVGRACCKYCARAEALSKLISDAEKPTDEPV